MNPALSKYITQAREKSLKDDEIIANLSEAGWEERTIKSALKGEPNVPTPNLDYSSTSIEDDYRHLSHPLNTIGYIITLILLSLTISSLCYIFITAINFYFPEQGSFASGGYFSIGGLNSFLSVAAYALASIIIATPVYLVINYYLRKYEIKLPKIRKSYARRLLVFAVALVTFWVMIGYGVWFLFSLFLGEFTVNKLLTFLTIVIINAVPFAYYLIQLKNDRQTK